MDLQNRENFLNKLAAKMGKARAIIPEPMDVPVNTYPTERLTHLSAVDLANEFTNSAKTMMVDVNVCRESDAVQTLLALCEKYGGGDVVLNSDERLFLRRLKRNILAIHGHQKRHKIILVFLKKLILVWFMQNMVWRKLAESSYSLVQIVDVQ